MKCLNECGNESRGRSMYCSAKCKVRYNRNKKRNKSVTDVTENKSVTKSDIPVGNGPLSSSESRREEREFLNKLTAAQLYSAINHYPEDTWKDSPEYKELMKRLHSMSIEELRAGGYDIPCWKYSEAA